MMKRLFKKMPLFYKYLVSYTVIFLVPFVLTSSFFYHSSTSKLQEEIIQSNLEKIEQVSQFNDSRSVEFENTAMHISLNPKLTPYMMKQPFESKQGIRELISHKVNSNIVDDILLFYNNDPFIYTTRGTTSVTNFTEMMYPFTEADKKRLLHDLKNITEPLAYPLDLTASRDEKMIAYMYPIPQNEAATYGSVVFLIRENQLASSIPHVLGGFDGNVFVFNNDGQLLTSHAAGDKLSGDWARNFSSEEDAVVLEETFNDVEYAVIPFTSEQTNWSYITAVPTDQFYARMSHFKQLNFIVLSVILVIGIGLSIFLSRKQYEPIQEIIHLVKENKKEQAAQRNRDELLSIKNTIRHMSQDNATLQDKLKIQQPYVRDQLLFKLLKGHPINEIEHKHLEKHMELKHNNHFFTILIRFRNDFTDDHLLIQREKLLQWASFVSLDQAQGFGIELLLENALVMVVQVDGKEKLQADQRHSFTTRFSKQLQEAFVLQPIIGVGTMYDGVDKVNRSFIEATAAIEYHLIGNRNEPIYFERISREQNKSMDEMEKDYMKFTQSLKQGDQTVAVETLSTMFDQLKQKQPSVNMLKFICFTITNTVLNHLTKLNMDYRKEELEKLIEFTTLDELKEHLTFLITKIGQEVKTREQDFQVQLSNNILSHIYHSIHLHELSLESTAKKFQVSVSYLSRFIKEQTGETFTQYVWSLRNNEFKRQLLETDEPIKNIVLNVGYLDVSNFTRKFKQKEGLTPGQYRDQFKNREQDA